MLLDVQESWPSRVTLDSRTPGKSVYDASGHDASEDDTPPLVVRKRAIHALDIVADHQDPDAPVAECPYFKLWLANRTRRGDDDTEGPA